MNDSPSYKWNEQGAGQVGRQVELWRKRRNLEVLELARAAGISSNLLRQIERGEADPSVATLFSLAEALEIPIDSFFAPEPEGEVGDAPAYSGSEHQEWVPATRDTGQEPMADHAFVVRREARDSIDLDEGIRWERLLARQIPNFGFLELTYPPGSQSHPDLHWHRGSEMILVISGQIEITIGLETSLLTAGDSMHFPSTYPHRYYNPSRDEQARFVLLIVHQSVPETDPTD